MQHYDVIIIGGGLSGLSLAIQLADAGKNVLLLEKNKYPFHRVCGEYISMESWGFLERLGVALSEMNLPRITQLKVTSLKGTEINYPLDSGGFGISRYKLDHLLACLAKEKGAEVKEGFRAEEITMENDFSIVKTKQDSFTSSVIIGSFGKRSNLDRKLNRSFEFNSQPPSKNWVGVKYHISSAAIHQGKRPDYFPSENTIELHNFENGYCGISKVEGDKYCLCYLTKAENLRKSNGNIQVMEEKILSKNQFLKNYFRERSFFLFQEPVTIAQITFENKLPVEKNILMLGDAAGMIAPLCGNGMSMALHSSAIAFPIIIRFLDHIISRDEMENEYATSWNKNFKRRLQIGRLLQPLLVKTNLSNLAIPLLKTFPFFLKPIIKSTHGKLF